jgi:hypothetical protein
MRILAILLLLAFGGGAYMLSRYVEKTMNDQRKYGSDDLVKSIRIHNAINKTPTSNYQETPVERPKQIIRYGGVVESVGTPSTTYFDYNKAPETNEGQPGQPLPLTGQAPMNPVYK